MIQREKIIAVIEAEHALINREFADGDCGRVGHCAIGALLFAAGMPNSVLRELNGEVSEWDNSDPAAVALREHYGLERWHASQVIEDNDEFLEIAERRRAVIACVSNLAFGQVDNPARDAMRCREFGAQDDDDDRDYDDSEEM